MEMNMYSINNLKVMEVIDINTGAKMGFIKDIRIDCDDYRIEALLMPTQKSSWFGKQDMLEIPWSSVKKVGIDVILVDVESSSTSE
jgi:sporulation protein, YlmC/YmxH family